MEREDGPFIARLPRAAGARESRYAHLFSGAIDSVPETTEEATPAATGTMAGLLQRLASLEDQVAAMRVDLDRLQDAAAVRVPGPAPIPD
jgi:uncharacterized protein YceH (UPF0502 family)